MAETSFFDVFGDTLYSIFSPKAIPRLKMIRELSDHPTCFLTNKEKACRKTGALQQALDIIPGSS